MLRKLDGDIVKDVSLTLTKYDFMGNLWILGSYRCELKFSSQILKKNFQDLFFILIIREIYHGLFKGWILLQLFKYLH